MTDLDTLEAIAKAATPGKRSVDSNCTLRNGAGRVIAYDTDEGNGCDVDHVVAFDPPTTLTLITRIRYLEGELTNCQAANRPLGEACVVKDQRAAALQADVETLTAQGQKLKRECVDYSERIRQISSDLRDAGIRAMETALHVSRLQAALREACDLASGALVAEEITRSIVGDATLARAIARIAELRRVGES